MTLQPRGESLSLSFLKAAAIFIVAAIAYGQYGFHGELMRDQGNHLYAGQRMPDGLPPYVSIFNHKTPAPTLLAGLGVTAARRLHQDDIYTVRLLFFVISCLTVVAVYWLARYLLRSERAGLLAGATFLCFLPFAVSASAGPQPKTPIILFESLALLFTSRKRWFWAGLSGSLAFLTWQPTGIYPLVTLLIVSIQAKSGRERLKDISLALAGMAIPLLAVGAYFFWHHALYNLIDGAILFNVRHLDRSSVQPWPTLYYFVAVVLQGYETVPILIGAVMVLYIYFWRLRKHRSPLKFLAEDRFAPFLISFPFPILWSLLDFQGRADFYVFLPYLTVGLALFMDLAIRQLETSQERTAGRRVPQILIVCVCAGLVILAAVGVRLRSERGLDEQRKAASQIVQRFGPQAKYMTIGAPQFMVILRRVNPTPYVFVSSGIDRHIDVNVPGGFDGWLQQLKDFGPDVIAFGPTDGVHIGKLMSWLEADYKEEKMGPWKIYVKGAPPQQQ